MKKLVLIILILFNLIFILSAGCISVPLDSAQTEITITPSESSKLPVSATADHTDNCIQESPNLIVEDSPYQIAFVSDRCGDKDIFLMNIDGSHVKRITNHPANDQSPDWSPNGGEIVFQSDRDGNWEIYKMKIDGSSLVNLTNHPGNDTAPAWSPDGREIVFVSDREGTKDLFLMDDDGTNAVNLTGDEFSDECPDWSPDGEEIIFNTDRKGNSEIYTIKKDGTFYSRLTHTHDFEQCPVWSSENNLIAYSSYGPEEDQYKIKFISIGSTLDPFFSDEDNQQFPDISDDGNMIVFSARINGNDEILIYYTRYKYSSFNITNNDSSDCMPSWSPVIEE